jgi:predicted PurR-regulated permease PerM
MAPSSIEPLWERLNSSILVRFLLLFASGWALVQLLAYFEIVVVVFVSATILAFLLSHPVRWCSRWLPHHLAAFLVFVVSLMLLGSLLLTIGIAVVSQGQRLTENIADFLNSLTPLVQQAEVSLQQWNLQVNLQALEEQLKVQTLGLLGAGVGLLQTLLANFINAILIAVVTFFMLLDGDRIWTFVMKGLPTHQRRPLTIIIQKNLLGFFVGRLLLSTFLAVSTFTGFVLLQIPYALTLAVIVGSFDLIPGIGATLGISLISLLLLSESAGIALKALVVCLVLQQIEENVLFPRFVRDSLNINPVVMFFALIVGARVAGLLGIFLAIPIAGVVVSVLEIEEMQGRARLKSANGALSLVKPAGELPGDYHPSDPRSQERFTDQG